MNSTPRFLEDDDSETLRGIFDENTVDPLKTGTTLDFEEIPDDIDIDEPIEVEKLSRFGRIMNVVILVTLIIFLLAVVAFIINAAFVVGAVFSANIQTRTFADVSALDQPKPMSTLQSSLKWLNFGRFISGRIDRGTPIKARVYLFNEGQDVDALDLRDTIVEVEYEPADDIKFDFVRKLKIEMKGISMKFNPHFDAGRLSGFMEPRNGDEFHKGIRVKFTLDLVPFCKLILSGFLSFPIEFRESNFQWIKLMRLENLKSS